MSGTPIFGVPEIVGVVTGGVARTPTAVGALVRMVLSKPARAPVTRTVTARPTASPVTT